ncbi:hypothetical protein pb186bvf_006029 [Paramecium bursaria]
MNQLLFQKFSYGKQILFCSTQISFYKLCILLFIDQVLGLILIVNKQILKYCHVEFFHSQFFILAFFVLKGLALCLNNRFDSPTQLYPTLNTLSYIDLQDYFEGSNLTYTFEGILNAQIYQTTVGPQYSQNLNGQVISSCQQNNPNPNFQNLHYLFKINLDIMHISLPMIDMKFIQLDKELKHLIYDMFFYFLSIRLDISILCQLKQQYSLNQPNQCIQYRFNQAISNPFPFVVNYNLQIGGLRNNFINTLTWNNQNQLVLGYSSFKNESVVLYIQIIDYNQTITLNTYDSQLLGIQIIDQLEIQVLLFHKQLLIIQNTQEYVFSYPEVLFVNFAILFYSDIQIFIATDINILIVYYNFNQHSFKLIDKIQYPKHFSADIYQKLQIFVNKKFLVESILHYLLTYQLDKIEHIFYSVSQNIQTIFFNQFNQTVIQVSENLKQAIYFMIPKLQMYFETIESGNFTIQTQLCRFELNYSVILSNNTQPLPSFLNQNYIIYYPKQQLWDIGNQFVGQNLTYEVEASDANLRLSSIYIKDQLFECEFDPLNYANIFKNSLNINQYMIIQQCEYDIHINYCDFQYCDQKIISFQSNLSQSDILCQTLKLISLGYFPRQVYVNNEDYENLIFLDEIFQLSIYQSQPNQLGLIKLIDIQYPIQSGDTSVGIGLLQSGIFIAQNDDQGNQFILYYPKEVIRQRYLLIQPQQIQIPAEAIIQFPIYSTFTSNKFYVYCIFNNQSELAVLRPSNDINSVLFQSFLVQLNNEFFISEFDLGAISIGNYDQLLIYAPSFSDIYSLSNRIHLEIVPQNLEVNLTEKVQLQITAQSYNQYQSSNIDFLVKNQIFDIHFEENSNRFPINVTLFGQNYLNQILQIYTLA